MGRDQKGEKKLGEAIGKNFNQLKIQVPKRSRKKEAASCRTSKKTEERH